VVYLLYFMKAPYTAFTCIYLQFKRQYIR
jgi:hypothetical protein